MSQPDDATTSSATSDSTAAGSPKPVPPTRAVPTYDAAGAGAGAAPSSAGAAVVAGRRRSVGVGAHLTSVVVAVLAVPGALVLLDYSSTRGYLPLVRSFEEDRLPVESMVCLGGALALLLLATAIGRLSGLGPLVAGLLWGVLPTVLLFLDPLQLATRLMDVPSIYVEIGQSASVAATFVFPTLAALLVGAGLAGRWRRPAA